MVFERGFTGKPSTTIITPSAEEEKKRTVSRPSAQQRVQGVFSNQPYIVREIVKPQHEEKPPEVVTIGAGKPAPPPSSKFNPLNVLRNPRKYFEEKIPVVEPNFSWISEKIPESRGIQFGYRPYSAELSKEIFSLGQQIGVAESGLRDIKIFIYEYPSYKKKYEESLDMISSSKKAPAGSAYWFDINKNLKPEESELFNEPMFSFEGEEKLYTKSEALIKLKSDWGKLESTYSELTVGKGKRRFELDIKKLKQSKFTLEEYGKKGYKFEKGEEGYIFSQPPIKELHEFYWGGQSGVRAIGTAAMEAFPTIVPIRTMTAGVMSVFTGGKAWEEYETSIYEKSMNLVIKPEEKGVNVGSYAARFFHPFSESGVGMNVYLPVITMGTGYIYSGLTSGAVSGGSKVVNALGKFGQTFKGELVKTGIKTTGYTLTAYGVGLTGITFGAVAAKNPEQLPSLLGSTLQGFGQAMGGWKLGQYLHGGGMPKIARDALGRTKTSTKTLYEDVSFGTSKEGQIKFIRQGTIETTTFGEKAGTSIKTRTSFRLKGEANIIGEETVATRITGITVKGEGQIFGKTYRSSQIQNMLRTGQLSIVESYGISKKMGAAKGFEYTSDKAVSGIYGKYPNVITSKGVSMFKELESTTGKIDLTSKTTKEVFRISPNEEVVSGKFTIGETKPTSIKIGRVLGYSFGSFESPTVIGFYQDVGISFNIKGIISGAELSSLGTGGTIKPFSQGGTGSLKTLSFKGESAQKPTSINIGKTVTEGGAVTGGAGSKLKMFSMQSKSVHTVATGSKNAFSFIEVESPTLAGGIGISGSSLISLPKTIQRKKQVNIVSQIEKVQLGQKNIIVQSFRPEVESHYRYRLNFMDMEQEMESRRIQITSLFRGTALKQRQLRISELSLGLETESLSLVKTVIPTITIPFMPTPLPPLFRGKGDYNEGLKTRRGFSWGGWEKKELSLKTVLADPFSVMESQIKFGKATHPLPTKKVWMEAAAHGWKLGTVELRKKFKFKKLKTKLKIKRGKKK